MRWFSTPDSRSTETRNTLQSSIKVQTSLVLNVIYHLIKPVHKYTILDLGPAFGTNIEFFSKFSHKIYIEDFYHTLASFDFFSPEDGVHYEAVIEYLLPYRENTRFDIIFSWDLFNYLQKEELHHLIRHLSRFCHPGTLLFALISTLKHIPERPIHFKILDQQDLQYESCSAVLRPCPGYQQTDLNRLMANFRVCNSFLLRNGFKEYLFVWELEDGQ